MAIQPVCAVMFGIYDLLGNSPLTRSYPWVYIKVLTLNTLPLVGLPVLFLLLFLAAVSLPFSKTQRRLTVAMALMQAAVVTISGWTRWNRNIHRDWHNVALARPSVQILGPMEWFHVREIAGLFSDVLTFLWPLGLLVFLIGLAAQPRSAPRDIHASAFQAKLLRAAQFAALFAVVVVLGFRLYVAYLPDTMVYYDTSLPARARRLLLGSAIPQLVTPLILLVSLRRYQSNAKQSPQPGSTVSAHSDASASSPEA